MYNMHQDKTGYLWIGLSVGQGAARFDGNTFTYFPSDKHSFSSDFIQTWYTDRESTLWVGTGNGLFRQEAATGQFEKKPTAKKCGFLSIFQDKRGRIWAGTDSPGLAYYDPSRDSMVTYPGAGITNGYTGEFRPHNSFDAFLGLFETPDSLIWTIATISSPTTPPRTMPVSIHPDRHDIRFYPMKAGEAMDRTSSCVFDTYNHCFWIGTIKGEVIRFTPSDQAYKVYVPEKDKTLQGIIASITVRDSTSLWLATSDGAKIFDIHTEQIYDVTPQLLQHTPCNHVFKDRDGNTWFVFDGNLLKLSPIRQQFPTNRHLPDDFEAQAFAILPNTDELIMASYNDDGVFEAYAGKPEARVWRHARRKVRAQCTGPCKVSAMLWQPEGFFWVGMNTGLGTLDPHTLRFNLLDQPIIDEKKGYRTSQIWVTSFLPDDSGDVWIGTWNAGLLRYETKSKQFFSYTYKIPLFNPVTRSLGRDYKGRLLIGSNGSGLSVWDPRHNLCNRYEPIEGSENTIAGRFIMSIHTDHQGRIWIGTESGICQFLPDAPDGKMFVATQTPKVWTLGIEADRLGRLWLKITSGLAVYDPATNTSVNISEKHGFTLPFNDETPLFKDAEQQLWYGNRLRFDPAQWRNPPLRATPVLTNLKIHDQLWTTSLVGGSTKVVLPYTDNSIRFEMAALDFDAPLGESFFKVKLDATPYGLFSRLKPGDWIDLGTQNFATFANLPPGAYTFHYLAGNEMSGWMEAAQSRSFSFAIRPHWANTWPFYVAMAALAMGLLASAVAFYYRYRLRAQQLANEKQQREAERQRLGLEKTAALAEEHRKTAESEMKLLRAQLNPHFLFNAMNSVNRYILSNEKEKASEYLGDFAQLTRNILDNSRNLTIPLADELKMLEQYLRIENHRFAQQITWDIAVDPDLDDEEIQVPSMFLQPFVENAILHGLAPKGGGHIEIRIEQRDGHLCCTLRDNGVGRQAKPDAPTPNNAPKRASVGMRLIAERLDAFAGLQGGQAEVLVRDLKDAEGLNLGTEVEIRVPMKGF